MNIYKIHYDRLIAAFVITFLLADICPYPNLPPGLIQSTFNHIHQTIVSK